MERCYHHHANGPAPLITEFDHYVYDRVFPQHAGSCQECFECCFDKNGAFKRQQRHDKGVILGLTFIIMMVINIALILIGGVFNENLIQLYVLGCIFSIIEYFYYGIKLIENMNFSKTETYHAAETWYEMKTDYKGDLCAEEHHRDAHYSSDGPWLLCIFLFLTMPIWVIPYTIILALIKKPLLHRNVPKQVLDAYYEAKRCVPCYNILQSKESKDSYFKHLSNMDKFYKKVSKIENKYAALGRNVIWSEIRKLNFPAGKVGLNGQTFVVIEYTKDKNNLAQLDCPIYLLGKNSENQYIGGAIVNGYLTPMDVIDNLREWVREISYSDDTVTKYLELYQNCL